MIVELIGRKESIFMGSVCGMGEDVFGGKYCETVAFRYSLAAFRANFRGGIGGARLAT
jgi:hypothetical protein